MSITELDIDAARACERVIYSLALYLDEPDRRREIGDLFTDTGVLEVPATGRRVQGRAAIADYFDTFPKQLVSRRLATNVIVDVDGDVARATSYFVAYKLLGAAGPMVPPPPPTQVGCYVDDFVKDGSRWRIARRLIDVTFAAETPQGEQ